MNRRQAILDAEGHSFPGATYAEVVLAPAYNRAKAALLEPMIAIHKAHLIMLVEQSLLAKTEAYRIMRAIQNIDIQKILETSYNGQYEDLFFCIEQQIMHDVGDIGGSLHLARSRNDMGVAMYRMTLRRKLLDSLKTALAFQQTLLDVAQEHVDTVMLGYTHTQQAQPTTLAHYLIAVLDVISRDVQRLRTAYANCNRSPLGAAALTTSGFPINRHRVAELLGFQGLVENSYDAIAGADYLGETASVVQLTFIDIGRFVQDLLLWSTQEFSAIRLADPYVQISSIMPQKRNPVSLEHVRALSSSGVGLAGTVLQMLHNTPFGDIVDTEDDLQPYLWNSLDLLNQVLRLLNVVVGTMEVNRAVLEQRARRSFATVTELADTLVREAHIPFRTAHSIVSTLVQRMLALGMDATSINGKLLDDVAEAVTGQRLQLSDEMITRATDPHHFVEVRSLPGGPSPKEIQRALACRRQAVQEVWSAVDTEQERLQRCLRNLDQIAQEWSHS